MSRQWKSVATAGIIWAGFLTACGYDNNGGYGGGMGPGNQVNSQTIKASGDLTAALTQFRAVLGGAANTTIGELPDGRREINWDGVPAPLLNVDNFPGDQFNRVVPRGQVFTTPGTGFRVSDNDLADLEATNASQFNAFSPTKTFIAVGSTIIDVTFRVAGTDVPALTQGFGVVFSDVDRFGGTTLKYFDKNGASLKEIIVPARSDAAGHSFGGVVFDSPIVARVRITAGQAPVAAGVKDISRGGAADLVDTDDFIAGEPHPIQ